MLCVKWGCGHGRSAHTPAMRSVDSWGVCGVRRVLPWLLVTTAQWHRNRTACQEQDRRLASPASCTPRYKHKQQHYL